MASKKNKGSGKGSGSSDGTRRTKVRVHTAKKRTPSSTRWLKRQLNDPYVAKAKRDGYRSRAAYKLLEINEKHKILKRKSIVVDLGAAPGSWMQVALNEVMPGGYVIGIDLQEIEPLPETDFLQGDFLEEEPFERLLAMLEGKRVDVVLSDMAAASCGHAQTDHIRIMALCEAAADFAFRVLKPGGAFLAKVLRGGAEQQLLKELKRRFTSVKHIKPNASRSDSAEMYVLGTGFKG